MASRTIEVVKRGPRGNAGDPGVIAFLSLSADKNPTLPTERSYFYVGTTTLTITLGAAATLGNGWHCYIKAETGSITLATTGAETIDGASTVAIPNGATAFVACNGTSFFHINQSFLALDIIENYDPLLGAIAAETFTANQMFRMTSDSAIEAISADAGIKDLLENPGDYLPPIGSLVFPGDDVVPAGTVNLNGQTLNRSGTHANLWSWASGGNAYDATGVNLAKYGPGNGTTTFTVPDWRGYAMRIADQGAGIDVGRAILTFQQDQFQGHDHHTGLSVHKNSGTSVQYGDGLSNDGKSASDAGLTAAGGYGTPRVGDETRMKNVSLPMVCARYKGF